jgi:hypothetical protein
MSAPRERRRHTTWPHHYLLYGRRWTPELIDALLGEPDSERVSKRGTPIRNYSQDRVRAAERTEAFRARGGWSR